MKIKKGLTLIEVVISIALIGIVAIVFLNIFSTSNMNIARSTEKTKEINEIKKEIDIQIKKSVTGESTTNGTIEVTLIEGIEAKEIEGKFISKGKDDMVITTFIPKK